MSATCIICQQGDGNAVWCHGLWFLFSSVSLSLAPSPSCFRSQNFFAKPCYDVMPLTAQSSRVLPCACAIECVTLWTERTGNTTGLHIFAMFRLHWGAARLYAAHTKMHARTHIQIKSFWNQGHSWIWVLYTKEVKPPALLRCSLKNIFQVFLRPNCMLFYRNHMRCPRFSAQKDKRFSINWNGTDMTDMVVCHRILLQMPCSVPAAFCVMLLRSVVPSWDCKAVGDRSATLDTLGTSRIKMNQEYIYIYRRYRDVIWCVLHTLNRTSILQDTVFILGLLEARMLWVIFSCSGSVKLFRVFKGP